MDLIYILYKAWINTEELIYILDIACINTVELIYILYIAWINTVELIYILYVACINTVELIYILYIACTNTVELIYILYIACINTVAPIPEFENKSWNFIFSFWILKSHYRQYHCLKILYLQQSFWSSFKSHHSWIIPARSTKCF